MINLVLLFLAPAGTLLTLGERWPQAASSPRWRSRLASLLERQARWLRRQDPPTDPFAVLRVQMRLGVLAEELRRLESSNHVYAKAHRLQAVRAAYDDLLEEACRMAGVDLDPKATRGESERFREEVELTARGWSW